MLPPCTEQSERFLLKAATKPSSNSAKAFESTSRMRNSVDPAELVLNNLHKHPVNIAIKMLRVRLDQLNISIIHDDDDDIDIETEKKKELRDQIIEKSRNLEIFRDIIAAKSKDIATNWCDLEKKCSQDPIFVARKLARLGEHFLARRVCDTFVPSLEDSSKLREDLTALWAFDMLTSDDDKENVVVRRTFHMLGSLESSSAFRVCEDLLRRLGDRMLHTQLLLVRYLREGGFKSDRLAVLELSLRILTRLSTSLAKQLSHLIGKPALILESLMMAKRLEAVKLLLGESHFVSLRNDELSIRLAGRALEMSKSSMFDKENEDKDILSFVLTGDESRDAKIRRDHVYPNTPSVDLAKLLLELCASSLAAADAAVSFCDRLCVAPMTPMANQLIRHLLTYARRRFGEIERNTSSAKPPNLSSSDSERKRYEIMLERNMRASSGVRHCT